MKNMYESEPLTYRIHNSDRIDRTKRRIQGRGKRIRAHVRFSKNQNYQISEV